MELCVEDEEAKAKTTRQEVEWERRDQIGLRRWEDGRENEGKMEEILGQRKSRLVLSYLLWQIRCQENRAEAHSTHSMCRHEWIVGSSSKSSTSRSCTVCTQRLMVSMVPMWRPWSLPCSMSSWISQSCSIQCSSGGMCGSKCWSHDCRTTTKTGRWLCDMRSNN